MTVHRLRHDRPVLRTQDVTAIIVTRGDVDLAPVLDPLPPFRHIEVWDNSRAQHDLKLLGRWWAAMYAPTPTVFVLDDDCTTDPEAIVAAYEPGRIVANMPASRWPDYPDSCLVGWGAVFDANLVLPALMRWAATNPMSGPFLRDCDVVMTTLIPHTKIDVGFAHLPWAETPGRLFKEPDHAIKRELILKRARDVRDGRDTMRRPA